MFLLIRNIYEYTNNESLEIERDTSKEEDDNSNSVMKKNSKEEKDKGVK